MFAPLGKIQLSWSTGITPPSDHVLSGTRRVQRPLCERSVRARVAQFNREEAEMTNLVCPRLHMLARRSFWSRVFIVR